MTLEFTPTSRTGAYALRKQWGNTGLWTLVIGLGPATSPMAQAIVELGVTGDVATVQVPTRLSERADMPVPRQVTAQEIERSLRARYSTLVARK